jgi:hypothetical protein
VTDEKKKDADLMMHSVAMQEEYIKKDDWYTYKKN